MNTSVNTSSEQEKMPAAGDLRDIIKRPAGLYPDKICFKYKRSKEDYSLSYAEVDRIVDALGTALISLGLSSSHIAVVGDKCPEWITTYLAVVGCGAVVVPLDRELDHEQMRGFVNFADCECVFYTSGFAQAFDGYENEMPGVKLFVEMPIEAPLETSVSEDITPLPEGKYTTFSELTAYGMSASELEISRYRDFVPTPEKMCAIIFTSGTTGTSKGVMLTHKSIAFCVNKAYPAANVSPEDVLVSVLPLHHTYEMTAGILAPIFIGCTICLNDSIVNALRDFKYYSPTILILVPLFVTTIYKRIIEAAEKKGIRRKLEAAIRASELLRRTGIDLRKNLFGEITGTFGGRLTRVICGGAPMNPDLVDKFEAFGIRLLQGYGITECSPIISVVPIGMKRADSCGKLLEGMQVYIDKDEAADESGEIVVKGDNVMLGYYKNEAATRAVLSERGWFSTGDCGRADPDGFLYITGRKKNVIVLSNGKNVFPEEIEEYLEEIPYIKECAVVGRGSDDEGIKVTAIIHPDYEKTAEEGLDDEDKILAFFRAEVNNLNKNLAQYKQVRGIEIRKTPFHKTTTHKIQRHKIDNE